MSLWIKSNNGNLINMDKIEIIQIVLDENKKYWVRILISNQPRRDYIFKSKERCQEIINEIQSHISYCEYAKNYNLNTQYKSEHDSYMNYTNVYEMPKE